MGIERDEGFGILEVINDYLELLVRADCGRIKLDICVGQIELLECSDLF